MNKKWLSFKWINIYKNKDNSRINKVKKYQNKFIGKQGAVIKKIFKKKVPKNDLIINICYIKFCILYNIYAFTNGYK